MQFFSLPISFREQNASYAFECKMNERTERNDRWTDKGTDVEDENEQKKFSGGEEISNKK